MLSLPVVTIEDRLLRNTMKMNSSALETKVLLVWERRHIAHLQEQGHNSKCVIFQKRLLKVLKCYDFLWLQRRHNCSPAASFANCVMKLYVLKVHLQTFLSIPITQKCQIFSCDRHSCRKWATYRCTVSMHGCDDPQTACPIATMHTGVRLTEHVAVKLHKKQHTV